MNPKFKKFLDRTMMVLILAAIVGAVLYGIYCFFGVIGSIIYLAMSIVLLFWIAKDIRHAAEEDASNHQNATNTHS